MVFGSSHTWGDKLEDGLQGLFDFLPNLIAFIAVLVIGYFVAKIIAGALSKVLERTGLDRTLTEGQGGQYVAKVTQSPSRLLSRIAFWAVMLGVLSLAASVLGISALTAFVGTVFAYLPNVVAALAIFLVAGALAAGIGALVSRTMGDTPTGKVVATVVPGLVMAIAVFMILEQLQIAPEIVRITYAALLGALALAAALAFGLGGRDVAARMLEGAYQRGQESREQVRRDLQQGKERARQDLERTRESAEERTELPVRDAAATGSTAVR
jgi:mechanosensitive ion channel-like protein